MAAHNGVKHEIDSNANFMESRLALNDGNHDELLDTDEALTAEFRFRIGMLDDDEELSEAFKASIGLTGPEAMPETTEIDIEVEKQYEATLKSYKFDRFAKKNFKGNQSPSFSKDPIELPLLAKKDDLDKMIAPMLWLAIQRFMGDIPTPPIAPAIRSKVPMMTKIFKSLEANTTKKRHTSVSSTDSKDSEELVPMHSRKSGNRGTVSEKRKSWKQMFSRAAPEPKRVSRQSSVGADDIEYPQDHASRVNAIPSDELDLLHYIIGHGILRRDLRDEIYCQLCKQLKNNPGRESNTQGWVLMCLCAGCFLASDQVGNYIQSYLRAVRGTCEDYAIYSRRILKRTNMNGPRYHPPNWLEFQATKMRKFVMLPVALPDGTMISVEADAAITASEVCAKVAVEKNIKDVFGFSLFICIFDKVSSLGGGLDHVMDAVSECEQLMKSKGQREEDAPWRLYFRKELFVPWHNPEYCSVASDFIYRQICKGIKKKKVPTATLR